MHHSDKALNNSLAIYWFWLLFNGHGEHFLFIDLCRPVQMLSSGTLELWHFLKISKLKCLLLFAFIYLFILKHLKVTFFYCQRLVCLFQTCIWFLLESYDVQLNVFTCSMIFGLSEFLHQVGLSADKLWLHSDPVSRKNSSVNEEVTFIL